ncbi:MAG: hypothetical protein ABIJ12_10320 [bacterium]
MIESSENEISFGREIIRKTTHMGALIIPGTYYFLRLSKGEMLWIIIPAALSMIFIDITRIRRWKFWTHFASKIGSSIIRSHEHAGDFTGASYILTAFCLTIALFSKPIAITAMAFIIVGDTFAALIGRRFGYHRFRNKSIEGSLACLLSTMAVALVIPGLELKIGIFGAFIATIVEAAPFGIDDNVTVPLLSGLAMTILIKILLFY